ncbi:hypothetical protein K435DRAFT_856944 [Dendrothele bispora CBS 962.96]|uniref:Uncharacterized protein n=1 Tax=Dendrothele bispora (strain CBS 962.96) TaxID=1314807 RepID=A0A4S8M7S4_DENBC|nr:hypothetical protein K435DRAFT_856944 [Dendrothele bispora CBS 962.96]
MEGVVNALEKKEFREIGLCELNSLGANSSEALRSRGKANHPKRDNKAASYWDELLPLGRPDCSASSYLRKPLFGLPHHSYDTERATQPEAPLTPSLRCESKAAGGSCCRSKAPLELSPPLPAKPASSCRSPLEPDPPQPDGTKTSYRGGRLRKSWEKGSREENGDAELGDSSKGADEPSPDDDLEASQKKGTPGQEKRLTVDDILTEGTLSTFRRVSSGVNTANSETSTTITDTSVYVSSSPLPPDRVSAQGRSCCFQLKPEIGGFVWRAEEKAKELLSGKERKADRTPLPGFQQPLTLSVEEPSTAACFRDKISTRLRPLARLSPEPLPLSSSSSPPNERPQAPSSPTSPTFPPPSSLRYYTSSVTFSWPL